MIQLSPPLIAGPGEFDRIVEVLGETLEKAARRLKAWAGARRMTTRETIGAALYRARIRELTEREARRLDERTPTSSELFERARQTMPNGVASTYQDRVSAGRN